MKRPETYGDMCQLVRAIDIDPTALHKPPTAYVATLFTGLVHCPTVSRSFSVPYRASLGLNPDEVVLELVKAYFMVTNHNKVQFDHIKYGEITHGCLEYVLEMKDYQRAMSFSDQITIPGIEIRFSHTSPNPDNKRQRHVDLDWQTLPKEVTLQIFRAKIPNIDADPETLDINLAIYDNALKRKIESTKQTIAQKTELMAKLEKLIILP